jgi:hypothetical protein
MRLVSKNLDGIVRRLIRTQVVVAIFADAELTIPDRGYYCPLTYIAAHAAVVKADSPENALELLKHRLGDHCGVRNQRSQSRLRTTHTFLQPEKGRIITRNE